MTEEFKLPSDQFREEYRQQISEIYRNLVNSKPTHSTLQQFTDEIRKVVQDYHNKSKEMEHIEDTWKRIVVIKRDQSEDKQNQLTHLLLLEPVNITHISEYSTEPIECVLLAVKFDPPIVAYAEQNTTMIVDYYPLNTSIISTDLHNQRFGIHTEKREILLDLQQWMDAVVITADVELRQGFIFPEINDEESM